MAYNTRGRIKDLLNDPSAINDYLTAIRLNPYNVTAYENIAISSIRNSSFNVCPLYSQILNISEEYENKMLQSSSPITPKEVFNIVFHSYVALTNCYIKEEKLAEASETFNTAIEYCKKKQLADCTAYRWEGLMSSPLKQ